MITLSDSRISEELAPYGIAADTHLCEHIRAYIDLLLRWNERVSLTAVVDPVEILCFHFGESLFAANSIPIHFGRLADVGSGAGFPGIPLAMVNPQLRVTLIESNLKKAAFLSEVARALDMKNVEIARTRMSDSEIEPGQLDFATARAVGAFEELLSWSETRLSGPGVLVLWVSGSDSAAIARNRQWVWRERLKIPGSRDRFLLAGSPVARS